jgi:hypothetical protein
MSFYHVLHRLTSSAMTSPRNIQVTSDVEAEGHAMMVMLLEIQEHIGSSMVSKLLERIVDNNSYDSNHLSPCRAVGCLSSIQTKSLSHSVLPHAIITITRPMWWFYASLNLTQPHRRMYFFTRTWLALSFRQPYGFDSGPEQETVSR